MGESGGGAVPLCEDCPQTAARATTPARGKSAETGPPPGRPAPAAETVALRQGHRAPSPQWPPPHPEHSRSPEPVFSLALSSLVRPPSAFPLGRTGLQALARPLLLHAVPLSPGASAPRRSRRDVPEGGPHPDTSSCRCIEALRHGGPGTGRKGDRGPHQHQYSREGAPPSRAAESEARAPRAAGGGVPPPRAPC